MNTTRIVRTVCTVSLLSACVLSLAACSGGETTNETNTTGGVAATVNGVEIQEDDITAFVENIRTQTGTTDEDSWGKWLATNGYTPETLREEIVESYVQDELMKKAADEKNITVDSAEVDSYINQVKQKFEDEDKWRAALEQTGRTEEEYRTEIETSLKKVALQESFAPTEEPSEAELVEYAQMYAATYDGAKRSSHILFESADEVTAKEVLDKINAGELDFAEAATQYSKDSGSAAQGGDVGWDAMNSFVEEYTTALNALEKDQVSGLTTSSYGIHIIKCTDVFNAPKVTAEDGTQTIKVTSSDQLPVEWMDAIKQNLNSQKQSENFQQWYEEYRAAADVVINAMPEGLSYMVDMSKYPADDTNENINATGTSASEGAAATNTDGSSTTASEGATVTNADGSSTTTNADGTTTTVRTDGTIRVDNVDGSYTETDTEGVTRAYTAAGEPIADETGATTEQPAEAA